MTTRPLRLVLFAAATTAALAVLPSRAAAQTHVYDLNGTYADAMGGPSLVADGGTLTLAGYTFLANQGLSLSGVLGATDYSLVFRSSLAELTGFRKLVDYADQTADAGYYNLTTSASFYPLATGPAGAYAPGVLAVTVLTRNASTGIITAYVNGVSQFSVSDGGLAVPTGPGNIVRFFEDDAVTGGREASAGFVDYIATYDRVLSAQEVAAIQIGAVTTPEPATMSLLGFGLAGTFAALRRKKKPEA